MPQGATLSIERGSICRAAPPVVGAGRGAGQGAHAAKQAAKKPKGM